MQIPTRMTKNIITKVTSPMIIGPFNREEGEVDAVEVKYTMHCNRNLQPISASLDSCCCGMIHAHPVASSRNKGVDTYTIWGQTVSNYSIKSI